MLLTVDRLVVVRLAKLGAKLDGVRRSRDWTTRMPVSSNDEIGQVAQLSNGLLDVIATQIGELEQMAMLDSLTGLANRRAFDQCIDELVRQHGRNGQSLALVLIDVDYFKRYNDLYGHPMGDEALRRLGQVLRLAAHRSSDLAARVGGEEFALLLPCSDAAGAQTVAAQLLGEVVACAIAHDGSDYAVLTVSAGVALFASTDSAATLYRRADQALYKAKHGGRNRTVIASAV
jgi:diguanylate cyclase (GGDEF)-like protein